MSAINPASFVTPIAGLQLPSGLGPGAFNPATGTYSSRQQQKSGMGYPAVGTPSGTQGVFDRFWEPNQDIATTNGPPIQQIHPQAFQNFGHEPHQADHAIVDYQGGPGQQIFNLQARYATAAYPMASLQHPAYEIQSNTTSGTLRKHQGLRSDWSDVFQGLSLGP